MSHIRRIETYLSPRDATRVAHLSETTLKQYMRRGLLTQFRTTGGHRRYALSELKALHEKPRQ